MINQLQNYFTFETIYLWINFGILPFWLMIIFIPKSKITKILVNSIIIPLIISAIYIHVIYQGILLDSNYFLESLNLYLGLDGLYTLLSSENSLLIFWLHFTALNIFLGSWVAIDGIKYNIPRGIVFIPLLLIYFTGPLGLLFYWFIRIFYAKKLELHD